ncbi:hypothetical protein C1Y08_29530 [Pseudomonas sp. FW306-02-F02-AA]|nr:hypothetical protein C1Y08_29530 [Pseudomonas sp. FW306-02-F02-AA]PMZ55504.1 hypothetical protein C1X96_29680 [Pseudomonas sp. FW300-N1A5]PMZ92136.1 hypothetical protein C1X95_26535 [Pseudomonas sp. FW306-2-11AD]
MLLWRGSLLPLGGEAAAEQINAIHLTNRACRFGTASHSSGSKPPRHIDVRGYLLPRHGQ